MACMALKNSGEEVSSSCRKITGQPSSRPCNSRTHTVSRSVTTECTAISSSTLTRRALRVGIVRFRVQCTVHRACSQAEPVCQAGTRDRHCLLYTSDAADEEDSVD